MADTFAAERSSKLKKEHALSWAALVETGRAASDRRP